MSRQVLSFKTYLSAMIAVGMTAMCLTSIPTPAFANGDTEISYLKSLINTAETMLSDAQTKGNTSTTTCISNQLIAAKGFLNVAETSAANLRDAQASNDTAGIQHHTQLIELSSSKGHEIEMKLKQCSQGDVKYSGDTSSVATRTCKFEPCSTDPALSPDVTEGLTSEEQQAIANATAPQVASPFL